MKKAPADKPKKKRRGNLDNLRPPFTPEEARTNGRKGAIRSAQVRRARRSFAETLKLMLSCPLPTNSAEYKKVKKQMKALGMDWTPTVQDIPNVGMLVKAATDPKAFVAIRDTIGEKPIDEVKDLTPPPNIRLGFLPVVQPKKADGMEDDE